MAKRPVTRNFKSSSELYSSKLDEAVQRAQAQAEATSKAEAKAALPPPPPVFKFQETEKEKLPAPQTGLGRVLRKPRHDQDIENINCEIVKEYKHEVNLQSTVAKHREEHEASIAKLPRNNYGVTVYNYVVGSPKLFHSVRHPYTDDELFTGDLKQPMPKLEGEGPARKEQGGIEFRESSLRYGWPGEEAEIRRSSAPL